MRGLIGADTGFRGLGAWVSVELSGLEGFGLSKFRSEAKLLGLGFMFRV